MSVKFNADEIFEMAEEIERNGAEFYREAAQKAPDEQTKKMFLDMAKMEEGHLATFQGMRKSLTDQEKASSTFDPDNEAVMYLQAMADFCGLEGKKSYDEKLTGNETIKEIIDIAINAENESVAFYLGLEEIVPVKAGRDKLEAVIREELSHVRYLLNQKKKLA